MAFSRRGLITAATTGAPTARNPALMRRPRNAVRFLPGVATSNVAFTGPASNRGEAMGNAPLVSRRLRIGPKLPAKW